MMEAPGVSVAVDRILRPEEGPLRLLVSTSAGVDRAATLGHADYSYGFVLEAYVPVLERLGRVHRLDRPESRLLPLAERALLAGERPIHLAFAPLHKVYLTPGVPTIAFPFWEFPDLPNRPFGTDTRQDWTRMARYLDGIAVACQMMGRALERHARGPVAVVPVPLRASWFDLEDWRPDRTEVLECKHLRFEGTLERRLATERSRAGLARSIARRAKSVYADYVWPRLSPRQRAFVHRLARGTVRRDLERHSPLERRPLVLGGIVFTSVFNLLDERKNPRDLLTAFLLEFKTRSDATLVLKLTSCPATEAEVVRRLNQLYRSLGIEHRCRVVAILDYLDDAQMAALMRATTAYVNASLAEGACLPLQDAMASGRPVVAPDHTAMADYIDQEVGCVVGSSAEPTHWPHDPERRIETSWRRINWESLRYGLREVAWAAEYDRRRYARWSQAARKRIGELASAEVVERRLGRLITEVAARADWGATDWREPTAGKTQIGGRSEAA
ncbi:MAG: hypothetical protein KatS3mg108_1649 [Isosphaeraceae bacterium]|jgi:glycosyltransferase involved in cell wall biosynthesis|nr:MAG: hypothetical protein KatS3mg108_1649 [Isosphaeraceae bacterium]